MPHAQRDSRPTHCCLSKHAPESTIRDPLVPSCELTLLAVSKYPSIRYIAQYESESTTACRKRNMMKTRRPPVIDEASGIANEGKLVSPPHKPDRSFGMMTAVVADHGLHGGYVTVGICSQMNRILTFQVSLRIRM